MWNDHRSVLLSKLSVLVFMGALLGLAIFAPSLVSWLLNFSRADLAGTEGYFLTTIYSGCIPATVLLYNLFGLLQRISSGQVFESGNVERLRLISWSCIIAAAVCLVSSYYYLPWFLVGVSAAFMGLIVRVVKNVVAQAVSLQTEVDYTI